MSNSDSLPAVHHFALLIGFLFTKKKKFLVLGRASPVPNYTFNTCRFPYTGGFFDVASKFFTSSMVFALVHKARLPLCLFQKKSPFLTIRQNSLNVTTCIFTSTLSSTLPSRFRPNISVTPGDWLLGSLAIT